MISRISYFIVISFIFMFLSCSNDSSQSNKSAENIIFYDIEFNTGNIIINSTTHKGDFHKVYEYNCIDDGDNFYVIKDMKTYYFSANKYTDDRSVLIKIIKEKNIIPTEKEKSITVRAFGKNVKNDKDEDCLLYTPIIIRNEHIVYE